MKRHVRLGVEQTREGYERWASGYDEQANPLVAATAWVMEQVPIEVAGKAVVELGCGTGRHAEVVVRGGARAYVGVDASGAMLARARARVADERVTWIEAELARVPAPAAAFDVAMVVLVLEHLADLAPLAAELARLVAPGGHLRILDIHPDLVASGTGAHFHDGADEVWFTSVRHSVDATVAAFAAAGFAATCRPWLASGDLLAAVPRLRKHAGRPVLIDLTAIRDE